MCLMARTGPDALWPFVDGARAAAKWMHGMVGPTSTLPDPALDWDAYVSIMQSTPKLFKGWIKRVESVAMLVCSCHVAAELAIREVWETDVDGGDAAAEREEHACIPCAMAFASLQAWAAHASRRHAYRARHTKAAKGRACAGCGKVFATAGCLGLRETSESFSAMFDGGRNSLECHCC